MARDEFEFYTLDDSLRRDSLIEGLESAIWTERYSAFGDCQFTLKSTPENRNLLAPETRLGMNMSTYVMTVKTVTDVTDESGIRNLVVNGKSLEAILLDRVAMPSLANTTDFPNWVVSGKPGDVIRFMFEQVCVVCVLSEKDSIPFYAPGPVLPPGNIPEPTDFITVTASPDYLYNTVKSIADAYSLGFRFVRNGDLGEVHFEVYTGDDRTLAQTSKDPVVFDPKMESLNKPSVLTSTESLKTVAYVFAANGSAMVYAPGANPEDAGSDRKILFINSSNNGEAGPELNDALKQEAIIALSKQQLIYAFDGQLPAGSSYVYGRDYKLGDLVEEITSDGVGNQLMVTEQIFSLEKTGSSSYPTLSVVQVLTPGTWLSLPAGQNWTDIDPALDWVNFG